MKPRHEKKIKMTEVSVLHRTKAKSGESATKFLEEKRKKISPTIKFMSENVSRNT